MDSKTGRKGTTENCMPVALDNLDVPNSLPNDRVPYWLEIIHAIVAAGFKPEDRMPGAPTTAWDFAKANPTGKFLLTYEQPDCCFGHCCALVDGILLNAGAACQTGALENAIEIL